MFDAHCPLVFDTLLTFFIFFVAAGVGGALARRLRLPVSEPLEYGLLALTLGLGAVSYIPFALFALHVGSPHIVMGALFLAAAIVFPDSITLIRGLGRRAALCWREKGGCPGWIRLIVAASFVMLVPVFVRALSPPADPDALTYHLTGPARYLQAHGFVATPTYLQLDWPLGVEMLFALGLSAIRYYAAGLIQFGLGLTTIGLVYCLGRRAHSAAVGAIAAALAFWLLRQEMSAAYVDIGLALYATASVYALWLGLLASRQEELGLPAPEVDSGGQWFLLSALLAGFAASTKLSGVIFVFLPAVVVAIFATGRAGSWKALRGGALYAGIGLLVALPWYIRCWVQTGDPVFPYLHSVFHDRYWDAAAQARMTTYFQALNSFHAARLPAHVILMARAIGGALMALIGLAVALPRGSRPVRPIIAWVFGASMLIVLGLGIYVRFMTPVAPALCVLIAWAIRKPLSGSLAPWAAAVVVCLLLLGLGGVPTSGMHLKDLPAVATDFKDARQRVKVATGLDTRGHFLSVTENLPFYAVSLYVNEETKPDDVIVVATWEQYGAWIDRPTLRTQIWIQDALRYDDDLLPDDLRRFHAKYLVLAPGLWRGSIPQSGMNREDALRAKREFPKLVEIVNRFGEPLQEVNGYDVFRLHL
jgi:hypothetical protein